MREIHGIEFANSVASAVEKLIAMVQEQIGESHLFSSKKHFGGSLKFALRLPSESKSKDNPKAYKLFAVIQRTNSRAIYHRTWPVKSGPKLIDLTDTSVDEVFRAVMSGYHQVRGLKIPVEYQSTDHPLVLPGGQFESNRSKF